jgi:hypothetical protein
MHQFISWEYFISKLCNLQTVVSGIHFLIPIQDWSTSIFDVYHMNNDAEFRIKFDLRGKVIKHKMDLLKG